MPACFGNDSSNYIGENPWGVLQLFHTLEPLGCEIAHSRKQIRLEINMMIYHSIISSLGFLGISLVIAFLLSTRITTCPSQKLKILHFSTN